MSHWRLYYHVIWSTRDHRSLIQPSWEKDLYTFLGAKVQALHCTPQAINGTANHLHLILSVPPSLAVSDVIRQLKGSSSLRINKAYPGVDFAWQPDYTVFSLAESGLERLVGYVKAQKIHHAQGTLIAAYEQPLE
jgi:putative transposase